MSGRADTAPIHPAGDAAIILEGLTKQYGKHRGVEDLFLQVKRGQVFGYLGPNGAGKTTTIRIVLDFIRPSRGTARVFGLHASRDAMQIHRRVGYLPGELLVYGDLTGSEFVRYIGGLRGSLDMPRVKSLASRLGCDLSRPMRTLSHGNRQKVGLIQAFMHRPELLILDEPTNGLDPLVQQEFYVMVAEAKADGSTVFLSSHILPEIDKVCERVAMIKEGRLVAVDDVATLKQRTARHVELHFSAPAPAAAFQGLPGVRNVEVKGNQLRCVVTGSIDALVKVAAKYEVLNFVSPEPTLEDVFLDYYENGRRHDAG